MSATGVEWATGWKRCQSPECPGARVTGGGRCLAHLDDEEFAVHAARLGRGAPLDARGVTVDEALLRRLLDAAPRDDVGRRRLRAARFDRARFDGHIVFTGVVFEREACFDGAILSCDVSFEGALFDGHARFARTRFEGSASFAGTTITGQAWFAGAVFARDVSFVGSAFQGPAWFADVTFGAHADFQRARFGAGVSFDAGEFDGHATFTGTVFEGDAVFDGTRFLLKPAFDGAAFHGKRGMPEWAFRQAAWTGPPLATWTRRAAAALVDHVRWGSILAGAWIVATLLERLQYRGVTPLALVAGLAAAVTIIVRDLARQGRTGQSVGKRLLGLRLVRERDGLPVGGRYSIARYVCHVVDLAPAGLGLVRPLWHAKRQTFADAMLATVVVVGRGWDVRGLSVSGGANVARGDCGCGC